MNDLTSYIEAAMQGSGKTWKKVIYPNSEHGLHNDTGARFNADAAKAAWDETLASFAKYLA